ncbi:hypothetical protein [uncultured Rubinisphaera sp.]|uniref:hypothetical protein n=1 Tax=uncultured Rubinisphaera sp. TaxID=1678686 RepID=UPI0030DBF601|tara:strand:+ start:140 stop:772 length:633 start_codon:yes stop_codon:yes gene_type:complete
MTFEIKCVTEAIESCIASGGEWCAGDHLPQSEVRSSIPWAIVDSIYQSANDPTDAVSIVALTCTFVARRSLACWFNYCDDSYPLQLADRLVSAIIKNDMNAITLDDTVPCYPTEKGIPIVDCRQADTMAASESVAYAAAYFIKQKIELAVFSLSDATAAFNESPIASYDFEERMQEWLLTVAIPAAVEQRELNFEEQSALADFSPFLLRR